MKRSFILPFLLLFACFAFGTQNLFAQKITPPDLGKAVDSRVDKTVGRVESKVKGKVNSRINKATGKIDSKIDRTVDKILDEKTYKKYIKDQKKKQKDSKKAEKKVVAQENKDRKKAKKAGKEYTSPRELARIEEEKNRKIVLPGELVPRSSYRNEFVGSFTLTARYYRNEGGKLSPIRGKNYQLDLAAMKNKVAVTTTNLDDASYGKHTYMTIREKETLTRFNATTGDEEPYSVEYSAFYYLDHARKTYKRETFRGISMMYTDSLDLENELLPVDTAARDTVVLLKTLVSPRFLNDSLGGVFATRYWGEDSRYKIELWGDNSKRMNAIHAFNCICRYTRKREDLRAFLPINMMRVAVRYARIEHKVSGEVLILHMSNFSTTAPDPSLFKTPHNNNMGFDPVPDKTEIHESADPNAPEARDWDIVPEQKEG